jgi:hypothetical protein
MTLEKLQKLSFEARQQVLANVARCEKAGTHAATCKETREAFAQLNADQAKRDAAFKDWATELLIDRYRRVV